MEHEAQLRARGLSWDGALGLVVATTGNGACASKRLRDNKPGSFQAGPLLPFGLSADELFKCSLDLRDSKLPTEQALQCGSRSPVRNKDNC